MQAPRTPEQDSPLQPRHHDHGIGVGSGLALIGVGLIGIAAVQGIRGFRDLPPTVREDRASEHGAFGAPMPVETVEASEPQQAIGAGRASPGAAKSSVPPRGGQLVGLAANPIPNGTVIYRLWSTGRVEAMISTEENIWGKWVPVAPGLSTDMRRPQPGDDPDNPE
jgi:hypothetical protein